MVDASASPGSASVSSEKHGRHLQRLNERSAELRSAIESVLSATASIVLEIGCGHGHFLTAYAQAHGGEHCVGVDIAGDRIARANRKKERSNLANLHFIRADAILLLDALPPSTTITRVFILFPDPWPKLRHHKHRIVQAHFLSRLAGRLGEEGRLFFRTDFKPYFDEAQLLFATSSIWTLCDDTWPFEFETVFQKRAPVFHSLAARLRGPYR